MTRRSFVLSVFVAAGLIAGAGQAQAKPNFTGDWKLNVDKSNFGPMPAPEKLTQKIEHKDPSMKVSQSQSGPQGEMSWDVTYSTDGKETSATIGPMETKSTAVWEGDVLVVETKLKAGEADIVIKSKWTLSADGKTITQAAHLVTPQGELDMTYVMDKQ